MDSMDDSNITTDSIENAYFAQDKYYRKKVTIMVLTHKSVDTTWEFLRLLYKHTSSNLFNLIVLDNNSADGAKTPLCLVYYHKLYNNNFIYLSSDNLGVAKGRNKTYRLMKEYNIESDYILFLDNDQFVGEGWLEDHIEFLEKGEYDIIGGEAWIMNKKFMPITRLSDKNQYFSYVGAGGLLMKSEIPEKIGLFDEAFSPMFFEDPDFVFKSYYAGYKIGWNCSNKIVHQSHRTRDVFDQKEISRIFKNNLCKFQNKWAGKRVPEFTCH